MHNTIDLSFGPIDNANMSQQHTLPEDVQIDMQALMDALIAGHRLDEEVHRRIRERAERVREQLKKQHGEMNIAVDLIRQSRDEE